MPLHDVGYRAWQGHLRPRGLAAAVIAGTGIRLAWKSQWLRRAVLFAWSPALVFAGGFFAFEQAVEERLLGDEADALRAGRAFDGLGMLGVMLADALGAAADADVDETRRLVWSRLLLAFMRAPQAILLAIVIGLVAPPLVSGDLRAKAWLVYFTRPLGRGEYILGKAAVLAAIVSLITMLPALTLWLLGVLVSPSVTVAAATWDLPVRIALATAALTVPTVLLALAYSSLTAESRIAAFAWFATWVAGFIAHGALVGADMAAAAARPHAAAAADSFDDLEAMVEGRTPRRFRWLARAAGIGAPVDRWAWLSPYHALGVVQAGIFGLETRPAALLPPCLSLAAMASVSLTLLLYRVDAPTRA